MQTNRFPSRFRRASFAAARDRRVAVESVEARLLFHGSAPVVPLPDLSRPLNAAEDQIDLTESFAETTDPNTRVAFGFDVGRVLVELFDTAAPQTVANFLNYSRNERFDDTVVHRSATLGAPTFEPFVVQAGGYRASDLGHIPTFPAVVNEFRPNTQQRGTIAMAKQGGNPNSATSEWFFNLRDNRDILDPQNGGFTSFGQVLGNGMQTVDAIAALPVTTLQGKQENGQPLSLSDFPIQNNPPTPPQDYVNVNYIAELPDLTGVMSSNPALVTPTLQGKTLRLAYAPGAIGRSTITINATDRTGAVVQETFDVTVGLVEVAVGEGATGQNITYTDADGTVGVVTVRGGSANVSFNGTGVTQTPSGRNVTVGGTAVELDRINVTGGTPTITVRARGGGDGRLVVNGISGGAVRGFVGREVILRGNADFAGGIGRLDVFQAEDANITIGAPADPRLQPVITLSNADDTDITAAGAIRTLRVGTWTSTPGGPEPDVITAAAVNTLQVDSDFGGVLTITGANDARTINNLRVRGVANGTWFVPGVVGNVSIGSSTAALLASFTGSIRSFTAAGDLAGTLSAVSIRSLRAGSMSGANVTLAQPTAAGAVALGSLNVRGAITNSNIRALASDIGKVGALSITNSTIYAGVSPAEGAALPDAATDFIAPATIRSVSIRNRAAASFVNSDIAAQTLGRMNLGVVQTANNTVPFGIAADTIASVTAADAAGARIRFARLDEPTESQESADFKIRVF